MVVVGNISFVKLIETTKIVIPLAKGAFQNSKRHEQPFHFHFIGRVVYEQRE
jgi:hypothetical protein